MAGKKQFDKEIVMYKALKLFWAKGIEDTSLTDLEQATGLKRGSIYNSFRYKDGLFLEVLDQNAKKVIKPMADSLQLPDIREAIGGVLDALLSRFKNNEFPSGCLLTGACMSYQALSDEVKRKVSDQVSGLENALYDTLLNAQKSGQLSDEHDPRAVARYTMAILFGMAVMDNVIADSTATQDVADVAKKSLECFTESPCT
jgi:TetR/AcrR family transcriptional repressor of nem operon